MAAELDSEGLADHLRPQMLVRRQELGIPSFGSKWLLRLGALFWLVVWTSPQQCSEVTLKQRQIFETTALRIISQLQGRARYTLSSSDAGLLCVYMYPPPLRVKNAVMLCSCRWGGGRPRCKFFCAASLGPIHPAGQRNIGWEVHCQYFLPSTATYFGFRCDN